MERSLQHSRTLLDIVCLSIARCGRCRLRLSMHRKCREVIVISQSSVCSSCNSSGRASCIWSLHASTTAAAAEDAELYVYGAGTLAVRAAEAAVSSAAAAAAAVHVY